MKKTLLLVAAFFATISFAQGQEKALKQYGFWDNWFIQGQIGGSYTLSENYKSASFTDLLSPNAALSVGKYFAPQVGARLQLAGWQSKSYRNNGTYDINYLSGNFDALFNLTNIFLKYKEDRVFNLIGIVGIGGVHSFKNTDEKLGRTNSIVPRIGLQTDFRLSKALSFNIEANANLIADNFNGIVAGTKYDAYINVLAGLTYRFKERGFATVDAADPVLIQSLNDQINTQRAQIDEYKTCCEKKQEVVPTPVVTEAPEAKEVPLNSVVTFRIGKAIIDPSQEVSLYNVSQYLKENPDAKLTIESYCDKETGTAAFNQQLSEKRSAAVVKVLTEEYGISSDRFIIINNGDKVQPFPSNNYWNRVVIFSSK